MKNQMKSDPDLESGAEAERLALLPRAVQLQIIRMHRTKALDPALTDAERTEVATYADALEKHLRRLSRKKPR
jgi:hypothetical protein